LTSAVLAATSTTSGEDAGVASIAAAMVAVSRSARSVSSAAELPETMMPWLPRKVMPGAGRPVRAV